MKSQKIVTLTKLCFGLKLIQYYIKFTQNNPPEVFLTVNPQPGKLMKNQ